MKILQDGSEFKPVTLVIETVRELEFFKAMSHVYEHAAQTLDDRNLAEYLHNKLRKRS